MKQPETNKNYWDCGCGDSEKYIHHILDGKCEKCGVIADEGAESHQAEIYEHKAKGLLPEYEKLYMPVDLHDSRHCDGCPFRGDVFVESASAKVLGYVMLYQCEAVEGKYFRLQVEGVFIMRPESCPLIRNMVEI